MQRSPFQLTALVYRVDIHPGPQVMLEQFRRFIDIIHSNRKLGAGDVVELLDLGPSRMQAI